MNSSYSDDVCQPHLLENIGLILVSNQRPNNIYKDTRVKTRKFVKVKNSIELYQSIVFENLNVSYTPAFSY